MTDFDRMFATNGLSPLPDAELKELLSKAALYLGESDLAAYVVAVKRFNEEPMRVTKSHPGEMQVNRDDYDLVYWYRLRRDLVGIPELMEAAAQCGFSPAASTDLLLSLVRIHRDDFRGVDEMILALAETLHVLATRGGFAADLSVIKDFFAAVRKNGDSDRAFGILKLCVVAGMTLDHGIDIVKSVYAGHGIAGYVFRNMWDELDALGANGIGGDLLYRAVKAVHAEGNSLSDLTALAHAAATRSTFTQTEVFERIVSAYSGKRIGGPRGEAVPAVAEDDGDTLYALARAIVPTDGQDSELRPEPFDYFPEIGLGRLVHGILPYRLHRSLADGLEDLKALMEKTYVEGAWAFDPETETWFSFGGSTHTKEGGARHEFAAYDVSLLSASPVLVHVHPEKFEYRIAPDARVLAFPQLQTKLTAFLTAMPSGPDFGMLADLRKQCATPTPIDGLIVSSQGITAFRGPDDLAAYEGISETLRFTKEAVLASFDAWAYITEHGIEEPNIGFINRLLPHLKETLPAGFEIVVAAFGEFDPEMAARSRQERSISLPVSHGR